MNQSTSADAISSRWVDDIVHVMEKLGGTASLEQINLEIESLRPARRANWKAMIRKTIQLHSSDSRTKKTNQPDLFFSVGGIGSGIWGLRSGLEDTPDAIDVDPEPVIYGGTTEPKRVELKSYRVLRDTELARQLKLLYRDRCQICNIALELAPGRTYSEAHHIIPLGKHKGPDTPGNIIVLCPNHHALCDYGAIRLDMKKLRVMSGHAISPESVDYHNERLLKTK